MITAYSCPLNSVWLTCNYESQRTITVLNEDDSVTGNTAWTLFVSQWTVTLQFVIITQFVINYKLRWIATQFVIHRISNCVVMATRFVMYYKLRQNFIIFKYWKGEKKIDQRQNASLQSYLTMNSARHQSIRARHAKLPINTTIVQNAIFPPHFCEIGGGGRIKTHSSVRLLVCLSIPLCFTKT